MKWKFEHRVIGGWGRLGLFDQDATEDEMILGSDSGWCAEFIPPKKEHARLIEAAPEMLELLRRLASGYQEKEPELGSDIYDQSHELMLEADHYACLRDEAQKLLAKIEGEKQHE